MQSTGEHWEAVRRSERYYAAQLRRVARHVGDLVSGFQANDPSVLQPLIDLLERYSYILEPWARAIAQRMVAEVARRDATAWMRASKEIGRNLRIEVYETPLGDVARKIVADQVDLIKSIPLEAAQRVQALSMEAQTGGRRWEEAAQMIREQYGVSQSKATLIARTESAKASTAIVEARARHVGADQYRWWTAGDARVRPAHRRLNGRVYSWDSPPVAEASGERHHPGAFPNCRIGCYAEPIIAPP